MCGIIGYIGNRKIEDVLVGGLSRLEYRGYDSAGIATIDKGQFSFVKEPGKLAVLKELLKKHPLSGNIGVGHTRWATHGEPSQKNAHPHFDCSKSIVVVHNGIIENHEKLRKQLEAEGHQFRSDTDSEVLAHLVEKFYLKQNLDLEMAVRYVIHEIEGSYAFCVLTQAKDDCLIVARNGSPLVLGVGNGENFVASDATAFLDYTKNSIFLDDYQMAVITKDGIRVTTTKGYPVDAQVTKIEWDAKDASKEGYDHFMLKEIEEQPKVVEAIVRSRLQEGLEKSLFDVVRFDKSEFSDFKRILIQACGTSWHAALTGKFLFEGIAGIPTEVDVSSEFRYRHFPAQPGTLVVSITQSGETIDALMGLRRGKEYGFKTLSICNVLGSTIARESDAVIYTRTGPEIGVASTKAYTAQIAILFLLSLYWGRLRGYLSGPLYDGFVSELRTLSEKMEQIIEGRNAIKEIAKKYYQSRDFLFLGRGINYPNAHEGALKIKEVAYIHATGHPAGEMKHGPIALIDEKMPIVGICTHASTYEKMLSNLQEVKARHGKIIAIATEGDLSIRSHVDDVIYVPEVSEFLSPMLVALPLQYLAYYVAVLRGTDVDQPRNLAKSVTVE